MEEVIKDLQQWKEKAAAITTAAEARRNELLSNVHIEAKKQIAGIRDQNAKALQDLAADLQRENEEKEANVVRATDEVIEQQRVYGAAHLEEIADLLYKTVITV
jgi:glutamine amidotransferase-like uncharacterized protein